MYWDGLATAPNLCDYIKTQIPQSEWATTRRPGTNDTLLSFAIKQDNVDAIRILLPHFDVNDDSFGFVLKYFYSPNVSHLQMAWEHNISKDTFELICRANGNLKKHTRSWLRPDNLEKTRIFLLYGGRFEMYWDRRNLSNDMIELERGLLRCRNAVHSFLSLKKRIWKSNVDRFLVKEIALEIWRTRVDEEWITLQNKVIVDIRQAAKEGRLCGILKSEFSRTNLDVEVAKYALGYGDVKAFEYVLGTKHFKDIDMMLLALTSIEYRQHTALKICIHYLDTDSDIMKPIMDACIVGLPLTMECFKVLMDGEVPLRFIDTTLKSKVPLELISKQICRQRCDKISSIVAELTRDLLDYDLWDVLDDAILATRDDLKWL